MTSFEYRLHQVGPIVVVGELAMFPTERGAEILRVLRDIMAAAPDELTLAAVYMHSTCRGWIEIRTDPESPAFDERFQDRTQPLITYCTGGIGACSAMAAQTLKWMDCLDVGFLDGGLTAWAGVGNPVET